MKYYIYKIELPNNKCYIGQTTRHPFTRWGRHLEDCYKGKHVNKKLQAIFDEFGCDEWEWIILDEGDEEKSVINITEDFHVQNSPNSINRNAKHNCLSGDEVKKKANENSKRWYRENIEERRRVNLEYYYKSKL